MTSSSNIDVAPRRLSRAEIGQAMLAPRSVAIVGASDDLRKTTARPLKFLRDAGFGGTVFPVNPRRELVLGERAWASLSDLPEIPDHVFLVTDAARAVAAVEACGELGVPLVTVLAGGFGEDGEAGLQRKHELLEVAGRHGVRILGPNSIGVVNPRNGLLLTANAAFAEPEIPRGSSFVASQSGSVIGALMTRAKARSIGFAGLVSTGSEIDLTLGEICASTIDDDEIGSYSIFLESMENAASLADFAVLAAERDKPVTVYKLGRSDAGAGLSVSHTGALAGEDSEADAFFTACGFARVDNFEALIECEGLQRRIGPPSAEPADRVAVITSTGGGAAILVDQLETRGVTVAAPSHAIFDRLAAAGIEVAENLIVDLTLAGTQHEKVRAALTILQDSGEFDLVIFVIGSSARLNPELAVRAIAESAGGRVPIAAWALPDALDSLRLLQDSRVPSFRTAESCADSVAATLRRSPLQHASLAARQSAGGAATTLLDEQASAAVLADVGVPFPRSVAITGDVPADLTYPVVVKALSASLPHKSDAGAVVLGVDDAEDVRNAQQVIRDNVRRLAPMVEVNEFLVQEMIGGSVLEVLVGYRVSDTVGPVVMLAAGGVHVELYDDSSLRLAPVTRAVALNMVDEVKAMAIARGFRSGPLGDVDSLVDAIVAMSDLATNRPDVIEAEINPVAVLPQGQGVVALDALVRLAVKV